MKPVEHQKASKGKDNITLEDVLKIYEQLRATGYWSTSAYITGKPGTDFEFYDVLYYVIGPSDMIRNVRTDLSNQTYMEILVDYITRVRGGVAVYLVEDQSSKKKAIVLVMGGRKLLNQVLGAWFEGILNDLKNKIIKPRKIEKIEAPLEMKKAEL